ncbi:phospholipase D-like domain-containing protein [Neisseria perflava]|uniref:phospholipase D-like domain-containing protein n=1 Tax=Neisseria perflava TaxID=33053 RepID=UPI00209CB136|nr:hypothetical protein [Neisseria perflava]MCP1772687.1 hypothetical protein [Neisseria perflava]
MYLVVRLGFPTSPKALYELLTGKYKNKVLIRYFSSKSFHPKLYIFGNRKAVVGSANFTDSALNSNQEIVLEILSDEEIGNPDIFEDLKDVFNGYWDEAKPLDEATLKKYEAIFNQHSDVSKKISDFDIEVENKVGMHEFINNSKIKPSKTKDRLYYENLAKNYQICVQGVNQISEWYKEGGRVLSNEQLPLRLEVDAFINYVKDNYVGRVSDLKDGLSSNEEQIKFHIKSYKSECLFDGREKNKLNKRCQDYKELLSVLASGELIEKIELEKLVSSLLNLNAICTMVARFSGGKDKFIKEFIEQNDEAQIRKTINYVLYGADSVTERIYNAVHNEKYKLKKFKDSSVEELIGWVNQENLPIVNERVKKVLKFYGANIK